MTGFRYRLVAACVLVAAMALGTNAASAQQVDNALATKAYFALKRYCHNCHGIKFESPNLDILDRESLTKVRPNEPLYLAPGEPENSLIWRRMADGEMPPPKVKDRPSEDELQAIKAWIAAGAPFPQNIDGPRPFISDLEVVKRIRADLTELPSQDRPNQRYFSLAHLHNNSYVSEDDLRLYRAAFSKLINSISRRSTIITPRMIDAPPGKPFEGVIFRLDLLRDVGWNLDLWRKVMENYPYGLTWNDVDLQNAARDIETAVGEVIADGIPFVRVDWFVHQASRPPLYHDLLGLPKTAKELETNLGVDVERDFRENLLQRAGFAGSGVSKHNRLIDRHEGSTTQYYYKSYDFKKSFEKGVLFRFPLGPEFTGNQFNQFAFKQDGGEVIWSLPNGMQAYLIVDDKGNRIDVAPVEVVRDLTEISGSPQVVNGISCMGCHKAGTQPFKDSVRNGFAASGQARGKVDALYVRQDQMESLLDGDRARFLQALERACGPFLKLGDDKDRPIYEFPEPISKLTQRYEKDLGREEAARELGYPNIDDLNVRGNQKLQQLGLGPLAQGHPIPRAMWDTLDESSASIFQRTAEAQAVGSGRRAPRPN
jgi:serine/threonine-protein kinase